MRTPLLALAGLLAATEMCVAQTAIAAREIGLQVTVLRDACAAVDLHNEQIALEYLEHVTGSVILPVESRRGAREPSAQERREGFERRAQRHTDRMNSHIEEVPNPEPPPHPQPNDPPPTAVSEDEVKEREQAKLDIGDSHPEDRDIRPKPRRQGDSLDVGDPHPEDRDTERRA